MFIMIYAAVRSLSSKPASTTTGQVINSGSWLDSVAALFIWALTGRKV